MEECTAYGGSVMDKDNKQKSSLRNDSKLDREKNKVTGVKTADQQRERKHSDDSTDNNGGSE
jgi:hypothetical protein